MHTHANKHARTSAAAPKAGRRHRAAKWARVALVAAAPVMGAGAVASPALATPQSGTSNYRFHTIDNQKDLTFNQLLGINENGLIAGYFGSGMPMHPNQGYLLSVRHGQAHYRDENWPESIQTQVTGLNDNGVTVGFWSTMNNAGVNGAAPVNDNRGFVNYRGLFIDGDYPTDNPASPPADQMLGVNDHDIAVGFYTDGNGNNHAYTFNILRGEFSEVTPNGVTSPQGTGINNHGDIVGIGTSNGQMVGFLLRRDGHVTVLSVPGSTMTQALGVNDHDEVVGVYGTGSDSTAETHGFVWTPRGGFQTQVDDPKGLGATTINGVNDRGQLVGFYADANNNTDGFLADPR
jgi:hypothetical protein